ncbi:ABC transporter permease subunit [Ruminococcaceae bacterium OttesenSCG-928-D13]|nr:ABC transporter permease subunit [Ruminococcaceae bacterium OttesenSCG-928-D13]
MKAAQAAAPSGGKKHRTGPGLNPKRFWSYMKGHYWLYLFLLPAVLYLIIFHYVPLYGVQIAFRDYSPKFGITGSPWVGLEHFKVFINSYFFGETFRNTLLLSLFTLVFSFPVPIILALLLNQMPGKRYRRVVQTVTYAPYFISMVVICGMIRIFLAPSSGLVNNLITMFGGQSINFMGEPGWFRTIYVVSGVWQNTGWNAIIYLAALSGVSPELHEAAVVDGASKLQRIWHIDIPSILPTAMILLILNAGSLMSVGFEKAFLLQTGSNISTSEIISTYVYKAGIESQRYSYAAAVGLFNSVINLVLLLVMNAVSKKTTKSSLW